MKHENDVLNPCTLGGSSRIYRIRRSSGKHSSANKTGKPSPNQALVRIHKTIGRCGGVGQEHIGNRAPVLVVSVVLERDFFPKDQF